MWGRHQRRRKMPQNQANLTEQATLAISGGTKNSELLNLVNKQIIESSIIKKITELRCKISSTSLGNWGD